MVVEVGFGGEAGVRVLVVDGAAGAGGGGVGEAVLGAVGDDGVEKTAPVAGGDAEVGVFGALAGGDQGDLGVELLPAVAKEGILVGSRATMKRRAPRA